MFSAKKMTIAEVLTDTKSLMETLSPSLDTTISQTMTATSLVQRCIQVPNEYWMYKIVDDCTDETTSYISVAAEVYDEKLSLTIMAMGNVGGAVREYSTEEFKYGLDQVEQDIKGTGLETISVCGRMGWKRTLAPLGYKVDFVVYHKDL